ncbi:MAG TPA: hypothetical protein VE402_01750, partial [Candidatus Angelobacter sp.]|nr:hypothetical protein [Candidatus Angelobacter sp.]
HHMLVANKEKFDPLLIKAFVNTVGMYPAGTVVLLDTNEIGIVVAHNGHDIFRPKVKIVADRDRKHVNGDVVDLSHREAGSDTYAVGIVSALNPEEYGINVADALT